MIKIRYFFIFIAYLILLSCNSNGYPKSGFALKRNEMIYFLRDHTNEWSGSQSQSLVAFKNGHIVFEKALDIEAFWLFDPIDENGNIILLKSKMAYVKKDSFVNKTNIITQSKDGNILYKELFFNSTNAHSYDSSISYNIEGDKIKFSLIKSGKEISANLYNVRFCGNNNIQVYNYTDSFRYSFSISIDSLNYSALKKRIFY